MEYSMKVAMLLMGLQKAVEEAKGEHARNELRIAELHRQRMDASHGIENCEEMDEGERMLARIAFAERYARVSHERRILVNENTTLGYLIDNAEFNRELNLIVQQMTGQMQFLEHAVYHPRSCGGRP